MNLADLSIKRPIFITCVVLAMLAAGLLSMSRLAVDLFPEVTFPVVTVSTAYPGAGPAEVETLISTPLEDELSTLSGVKRLTSINMEGLNRIVAEFTLETDVKYAEQQIRDRVSATKSKLPPDIKEPVIRRIDPADQPILVVALKSSLPKDKLFDLADDLVKVRMEQVNQVGLVEVIGGRKREIHVSLDREKLKSREISASLVAARLGGAGENIPVGKTENSGKETVFRTVAEFKSVQDIGSTLINFFGNDVPTTIQSLGQVVDTLQDEKSRAYANGSPSLFLYAFKQSGANTIAVVRDLKKAIDKLNVELSKLEGKPELEIVRDGSVWINANVTDVKESIIIGTLLAVLVVFFFLGSGRSTIITGLALPNSLIGAFILMYIAGFGINIMTLLALSLSVGLLVDDAIVVRENIFRHIEMGKSPIQAAREGTAEVRLAVIATTLTVIAVFGPVGFLKGVTGQFFKQFGLTICFAMAISLFDALTIAPMLSAYFAGTAHKPTGNERSLYGRTLGRMLHSFDRLQTWMEDAYENLLKSVLRRPFRSLALSTLVFLVSCSVVSQVPKTFLPAQDAGEFSISLDLPPGTSLERMDEVAQKVDAIIRKNPEVSISALTIGSRNGDPNYADFFIRLVPAKKRPGVNTSQMKDRIRSQLKEFAFANPKVKDFDAVGGGQRPFTLNIIGNDEKELDRVAAAAFEFAKQNKGLLDADTSQRPGKPEFQIAIDPIRAQRLGVSPSAAGAELRTQVEGVVAAKLRENDNEYDIRVRLQPDQRNLRASFANTYVPNVNNSLVRVSDVANPIETIGRATIDRQDRGRYVQISADIAPGAGLGDIMTEYAKHIDNQIKPAPGTRYAFVGQAENFQELGTSMAIAMGLGILFIFLVLASLYESFVTPFTIMLALPLAMCGSFLALYITGQSLNIFSMIGLIMLLGVAVKNSILLVDYANQQLSKGSTRTEAILMAGKARLRPILMTTMALIAGTIPIALGLNEASRQRTSMGVAIVGGLISSTLLTLIVVPAAYSFVDRFRVWSAAKLKNLFAAKNTVPEETTRVSNGHEQSSSV